MAVGDKLLGAEGRWLMGRVIPRQFLDGVSEYLEHFAPDHKDDVLAAIKARAEEIVEADEDMATDGPGKGAVASCAVVLASYEKLLPVFEGDQRRTILFLQQVMGVCSSALTRSSSGRSAIARTPSTSSKRRAAR
jgi:hypothetical protein